MRTTIGLPASSADLTEVDGGTVDLTAADRGYLHRARWSWPELATALRPPKPHQPSDAPFWTDPYIATQLLAAHLDQTDDAASRPAVQLDQCVDAWTGLGLLRAGSRVLDIGCGPGLLAERMSRRGAEVTGVDLSVGSLQYARDSAAGQGLRIDYRQQDFLDLDEVERYDLIVQSYGEFGTLSDDALAKVLLACRRAVRPGGSLIFDVLATFHPTTTASTEWALKSGGLWRPGEHLVLWDELDYPGQLRCDRHVVLDGDGVTCYRLWKRAFTAAAIRQLLSRAGWRVHSVWSSLSAEPYDAGEQWLAVAARPSSDPIAARARG